MRIISEAEYNAATSAQKSSVAIFEGLIGCDSYLTIRRVVTGNDKEVLLGVHKAFADPAESVAAAMCRSGTITYFAFPDPYSITAFLIQQLRSVELAAGAPA